MTSRLLYTLAQNHLYRNLRFTFARCWEARNRRLLENLEQKPTAASSVHEIYINWAPGVIPRQDVTEGTKLIHRLVNIVPKLSCLKRLMYVNLSGLTLVSLIRSSSSIITFKGGVSVLYTL